MRTFKMKDATPKHGESSLCESCRHAQVIRGPAIRDEWNYCTYISERVYFKVHRCSNYDDKSKPTLRVMKEIAWELRTDKGGKRIGFAPPKEAKELRRQEGTSDEPLVLPDGSTEWD